MLLSLLSLRFNKKTMQQWIWIFTESKRDQNRKLQINSYLVREIGKDWNRGSHEQIIDEWIIRARRLTESGFRHGGYPCWVLLPFRFCFSFLSLILLSASVVFLLQIRMCIYVIDCVMMIAPSPICSRACRNELRVKKVSFLICGFLCDFDWFWICCYEWMKNDWEKIDKMRKSIENLPLYGAWMVYIPWCMLIVSWC